MIATLHPNEVYTDAEIAALETMERDHGNLRVDVGDMIPLLQTYDFVVTQNSSVAFADYFSGKPAFLFGKIDFHYIAVQADMKDFPQNFAKIATAQHDYAKYLYWFWQHQCINAGGHDVDGKIAMRFSVLGGP